MSTGLMTLDDAAEQDVHPPEVLAPLTADEQIELHDRETRMDRDRPAVERFTRDLLYIRDARLYRADYASFGAYCERRWGISRSHGYRLVEHARTTEIVSPRGDTSGDDAGSLPRPTEKASRELASVPDEDKQAVYADAVRDAGGEAPTAKQVQAAVAKRLPRLEKGSVEWATEKGYIPAGATVIIDEPDPTIEPEPYVEPAELTDEEWLLTLPARESIPEGYRRKRFDVDALLYRRMEAARDAYRTACRPHKKAAQKELNGHFGPYHNAHNRHFKINDPGHWLVCGDCKGACIHPAFNIECPTCKAHGYHV